MNYNLLGASDLEVSAISLGCMSLGKDQKVNNDIIHKALDGGINFFDTADLYDKGRNEEMVGEALKGIRQEVIIASKVGNVWNNDGKSWHWGPSKKYILSSIEGSLKRLGTDYLDLYQLHGGTLEDPIDEIIETFELLKAQGKIRHYGISSIRPNVIRQYIAKSSIVSVMMQYSLLDRRPEETIFKELEAADVSVITRGSLASGLLIDKEPKEYVGYSKEEVQLLQKIIQQQPQTVAQALKFALLPTAVATAAVGASKLQQMDEVLGVSAIEVSTERLAELSSVLSPNVYTGHRD